MSGICGIIHMNGAPVDRQLLLKMTAFMSFRGPDAQDTWIGGGRGFGHTLLRATAESAREHQPASLDGQVWITADARIDGQAELKAELSAQGRTGLDAALDHELILHAYGVWGERCVEHLIGDFAFAIWDGPKQQLFCARDHFGVKPFFYAQTGHALVFSNTLNCVRTHPGVSDALNDLAIADFLLFDSNQDPHTTSFADIRRLPPAHCLIASAEGLKTWRYWSLPTSVSIQHRPRGECIARFKQLLETAVADRLRTDRVGFELSGGLDSPALAASAQAVLSSSGNPFQLHAHTFVYDRLIPDRERHYSQLVADHLGIPQQVCPADGYGLFERFDEAVAYMPEPCHSPTAILNIDTKRALPEGQRVVLAGWDGDALLNESPKPYFLQLWKRRDYRRLLTGVAGYIMWKRRSGPLAWRDWLRSKFQKPKAPVSSYPVWLDPELERRLELPARYEALQSSPVFAHPLRPYALRCLRLIQDSSSFFEDYDPGQTELLIEYRHPLMDLRVIEFCLSLPVYPWCINKHLLREAMRGVLPKDVLRRPKSPLAGYPHVSLLRQQGALRVHEWLANGASSLYINEARVPPVTAQDDPGRSWMNMRPISLQRWLLCYQKSRKVTKS